MKRMPFEPPTDHYDEKVFSIDEQLCALLKQRKEISNNDPGFPPHKNISNWAKRFGLYEDLLNSVFGTLRNDEEFRPRVEPKDFRRHLPILKSVDKGEYIYTVTFIRQYQNASVVHLNIDWDSTKDSPGNRHQHNFFELFLGEQYDCRLDTGHGSTGQFVHSFIVFPPLPDDISGLNLVFREYSVPFGDKPTGLEISMHL
ncbi:hypothetical protein [Peribacillus butanolivorans]|uniref:hypothetical protein n=1 Tax=Peribacillus butanolivorans TaxID=421767 RepID=UPI0038189E27